KGIVNLGKMIPIVGGVVGGGFDLAETKIIANRAYQLFIEGNPLALENDSATEIEVTIPENHEE
ncbi:MAG: EcsC family protein, partial [Oscillospiraceae bacterium]|nr:EcsC family protein [Oscillospiraceae bacterium]